jgi:hypothetical protein
LEALHAARERVFVGRFDDELESRGAELHVDDPEVVTRERQVDCASESAVSATAGHLADGSREARSNVNRVAGR